MQIGELVSRVGIKRRTIRYYEDRGLVSPTGRSAAGYRHYDETVVDRLKFIKASKSLGLQLSEIATIMKISDSGQQPCVNVRHLLADKVNQLDEKIEELTSLRARLELLGSADHDNNGLSPQPTGSLCPIIEQEPKLA